MTFSELLEWQWSDYPEKHRNRANLLIHIVAVPVLWFGGIQMFGGVLLLLLGVPGAFGTLLFGAAVAGVSLFAQSRGHALEKLPPEPFKDPKEFARRIVAEQFVTFPRFVLTGAWLENLKAST
jgi:hypothetical protein